VQIVTVLALVKLAVNSSDALVPLKQYQWTCAVESCVAHDPARVGLEGM